jgi:hypothetical protein
MRMGKCATSIPVRCLTIVALVVHALSNTTIAQGLPAGQQSRDIGSPSVAGSVSFSNGTYTIRGAGTDIWDSSDQFRFVYQQMTGDGEIVARVASISNTHAWAKAGVMIREALTGPSRHAMALVSYSNGYRLLRRPDPGAETVSTSGGTGQPPGWVRLVRTGDNFAAYRSSNGTSWTFIASDTIFMADTVYVGLAVTSHNPSAATTTVVTNFRVTAAGSSNQVPTVSLTSPASGAKYTAPATIPLAASASDPENQLDRVEFFSGTTRLGTDTTSPFSYSWSGVGAGTYNVTAVAHDEGGASATSSAVTVTVAGGTTGPPRLVVFRASSDHSTNVNNYVLKIYSSGANPATATPIATSNLAKPSPASNGDITVDRASFFSALATGSYQATVTAIGPGGQTQSAAVAFTR